MGTIELDISHHTLLIHSHIITYGNAASEQLTQQIRDEIETMWNESNATIRISGVTYEVHFHITSSYQPKLEELEVLQNTDPRNNYFRIEEYARGNISFVDGLGCNSGYFKLENLYKGSTTAAHEYGHTLGLDHPTWLDIRGQGVPGIMYPRGNIYLSLKELLHYMISLSDNNACDILLKQIGGTHTVENYLQGLGINNISIKANEHQMARAWKVQYSNWCEPSAMAKLLALFYNGKCISPKSTSLLYQLMKETTTGPNRLKGLLPEGTVVAHKTGTSDTNVKGITAATNDVGIITLPDERHIALAVFISDSNADEKTREAAIARTAKAVWNYERTPLPSVN